MSYYDIYSKYNDTDWDNFFKKFSEEDAMRAIRLDRVDAAGFAGLLSPAAINHLEDMAQNSHSLTAKYFGKTILLYTPMYLSNYCDNVCTYCGFNARNDIERRRLSPEEVEREAAFIAQKGLKHILVLTGESRKESPVTYIKECVKILRKYFSSISIEIYPLAEDEYRELAAQGVDGLTIYQEVYDEEIYFKMHPSGPKSDYCFRLDAPERGAKAGIRAVNIGALLGLDEWRKEIFLTGLHAAYLQDKFPETEIGVSVPRLRPHIGNFKAPYDVEDRDIVQAIMALRIFLPRLGISISTRENSRFRENLLALGVTRMSAGSSTEVGGHSIHHDETGNAPQFDISDRRNVEEIKAMLERKGYQGVLKDWTAI